MGGGGGEAHETKHSLFLAEWAWTLMDIRSKCGESVLKSVKTLREVEEGQGHGPSTFQPGGAIKCPLPYVKISRQHKS